MNPYLILAAVIAIGVAGGGGVWLGMDYQQGKYAVKENEKLRDAQRAYSELLVHNNKLAQELEDARVQRKVVYRDIKKNVVKYIDRPVYRNSCMDDDGLYAANSALTGKTTNTGKSEAAVPGSNADGRNDR